ncbi:zinc finger protein 90-like isoform X1 [Bufo bufo]|uniref:zinc finger protein 90-like isoform X1 n=1 Tax=Bufo bufo TaxID=8384 RepID=UPI001ABDBDB6|nr:zinc finger protein 90-like isoform X1 [Bufo bufo]
MAWRGAAGMREESAVTFDDVAVQFSQDEWRGLQTQQKDLYREVMTDNYLNLTSLGLTISPPEIVVKMERGEEPCAAAAAGDRVLNGDAADRHESLWGEDRAEEGGRGVSPSGGVVTRRSLRLVKRYSGQWSEERRSKAKPEERTAAADAPDRAPEDWRLPADLCGGLSDGSSSRKPCKRAADSEGKLHTCGQCGESWGRLIDLLTHQMGNCQDRPHRCNICAKTFAKKQHLSAHRRTHTEERPYVCNQCGRSFRQNSTLTTHLWSHAGHKPFHCSCCPKSFSRKTDLVAHMRRHTGERPYECPYCWDRFIRKKSLQRHLQKHAGENLRTAWQPSYPRMKQSEGNMKTEELPTEELPTRERHRQRDAERRVESSYVACPPPPRQESNPLVEPIKLEVEDERHQPEGVPKVEQSTQTENKRPGRLHQEMLRELKRFRRSAAQAQHERDLMRSAMDQMAQEMKELKEMVASLCSSSSRHPSAQSSSMLVQNSCPVWSRTPEDRQSTESSRASPESSLQCGYGYPLEALTEQSQEPVSWMYQNPHHDEDDMLPTTTIKREEEEEEEEELSLSPEAGYYQHSQYDSCRIGERLPNISMMPLSAEKEWGLLARSAGKPGRFAALLFRALVPFDIYKSWVNRVNLDGLRGRQGIPLNVKRRVMAVVERHFALRKSDHSEIRNRLNEQLRTRRKSDKHPQAGLSEVPLLNR